MTPTREHQLSAVFQQHNRWLRVCLACAGLAVLGEGAAIYKLSTVASRVQVPIVSIDPYSHRANVVNYAGVPYTPHEGELQEAICRWANDYYSRDRFILVDAYLDSLKFFGSKLRDEYMAELNRTRWISMFMMSAEPQVKVVVHSVTFSDLSHAPYRSTVTFEKVFYSDMQSEAKREPWVADIAFTVTPQADPVNPLGVRISYIHETKGLN